MCIHKFEVTDKRCKLVDFFLSPTNTTVTPSRILHCRYRNPVLRITNQETRRLSCFATIAAVNMVQNTFTHLHQKCEVTDKLCTSANQYVNSCSEICTLVECFLTYTFIFLDAFSSTNKYITTMA